MLVFGVLIKAHPQRYHYNYHNSPRQRIPPYRSEPMDIIGSGSLIRARRAAASEEQVPRIPTAFRMG